MVLARWNSLSRRESCLARQDSRLVREETPVSWETRQEVVTHFWAVLYTEHTQNVATEPEVEAYPFPTSYFTIFLVFHIFYVHFMTIFLLSLYVFIVSTFTRWCIWRTDLSSPTTMLSAMMSKVFHAELGKTNHAYLPNPWPQPTRNWKRNMRFMIKLNLIRKGHFLRNRMGAKVGMLSWGYQIMIAPH